MHALLDAQESILEGERSHPDVGDRRVLDHPRSLLPKIGNVRLGNHHVLRIDNFISQQRANLKEISRRQYRLCPLKVQFLG